MKILVKRRLTKLIIKKLEFSNLYPLESNMLVDLEYYKNIINNLDRNIFKDRIGTILTGYNLTEADIYCISENYYKILFLNPNNDIIKVLKVIDKDLPKFLINYLKTIK